MAPDNNTLLKLETLEAKPVLRTYLVREETGIKLIDGQECMFENPGPSSRGPTECNKTKLKPRAQEPTPKTQKT